MAQALTQIPPLFVGLRACCPSLLLEVTVRRGVSPSSYDGWMGEQSPDVPGQEEGRAPSADACRGGGWALSLAHVRQGPRAGGGGPRSCTALGKKQAQDVSSGAFLFSNPNSS